MVSEMRCHVCDPLYLLGPPVGSPWPEKWPLLGVWSCLRLERDWFTLRGQWSCASLQVRPLEVDSLVNEEKDKWVPDGLLKENTFQKDSDSLGGLL